MPEASEGLVSGRSYTSTRPRGFAPWSPRQETLDVIAQVRTVLSTYQAQLPLTVRQIFYVLVAGGYPKTDKDYARLGEYISRARRANMIDFSAIRDDGTESRGFEGWDTPYQWQRAIRHSAENYTHNLTEGQDYHVELWVEAAGMVPQAAAVAGGYGIRTYSAGGFNGLTDKYETASRLHYQERPTIVLHAGDHDPSGLSIIDSLADDVTEFCRGLGTSELPEFRRILITPEQIERYSLPTAPQKVTDRRGEQMDETVQAEALPPDVLASEIREAIEELTDLDQLGRMRRLGNRERTAILGVLDGLSEIELPDSDEDE